MTDETKYKPLQSPQTEFKIRETGEVEFKGSVESEILTQILDTAQIRSRRFQELERARANENQIIGIVCIVVGFFVCFTITFAVVHGIKTVFFTQTEEVH